jgi:hypothetical protein
LPVSWSGRATRKPAPDYRTNYELDGGIRHVPMPARSKSQNLAVFSQAVTEDQWRIVLYYIIGAEFVVAHGSQVVRWPYLPDGAARLDVESGFAKSYQWYESVDCQATTNEGHEANQSLTIYGLLYPSNARRLNGVESVQPLALGKHPFESRASETANLG